MFEQLQVRRRRSGLRVLPAFLLALLLAFGSTACGWAEVSTGSAAQGAARRAELVQSYGKMPLSFEANRGQADKSAKFIARGNGYGLYLTGQDAVLVLRKPKSGGNAPPVYPQTSALGVTTQRTSASVAASGAAEASAGRPQSTTDVLRMQLAGAKFDPEPDGLDPLPGTVNYFLGNDPAKWRSGIPTFGKVQYRGIYRGVDLVYYGNQQSLEYDFVVAPGADTKPIRLRFAGARKITIDSSGNLAIVSRHGSIAFHKPEVYQTIAGVRRPIVGRFRLLAHDQVGFAIGSYDHASPLVIDPILAYSTFFGGTTADFVAAIAADSGGNAYVTGLTASEDFPLTAGAFQAINYATPTNQVSTAFVSKFNASGSALLYSTFVGGNGVQNSLHNQGDYGKAIAVDAAGNAYITGYTYSTNFPITSGAFQPTNKAGASGLATGFVTKLNPSGTALVYSTYLGGSVLDELSGIALDTSGDAFISGVSFSADYPTTSGAIQTVNKSYGGNGYNSVVTKLNPAGSGLIYSTYLGGGSSNGSGLGTIYWTNPIVVDKSGDAYVAGFTASGNFPVTTGAYQTLNHGAYTVTVSKLNPTASALIYSTYLGGSSGSICEGLAVDSAGNAYVAGYTSDLDFPVTSGAFQTTNKSDQNTTNSQYSNENGFLTKINPAGSGLVYSTYLGGTTGPWGGDQIYYLGLDSAGDAYVTGSAMSADFPVTSNAYQSTNKGATHCCDYTTFNSNAFLTEFNPAGSGLIYSTYLGGTGQQTVNGVGLFGDTAYALALGQNGNVYIGGFTTSSNFPVTPGAFDTKYLSVQNLAFVADFDLGSAPTTKDTETTLTASANPVVPGTTVTFSATVAPLSGTVTPTGNVVFSVDEASVATVALTAGKASYSTSSLVPGEHYVVASYGGSSTYAASGDGFNEVVIPITPVIAPAKGTYYSQQWVTITDVTAGAQLYYTLDGSTPTVFSTPYTGPIAVNKTTTVSAVAVSQHDASSAIVSANYAIIGSPLVLVGPATAVATPNATLNAFVNTLGIAGTCYFQFGTSSTALTGTTASTALTASTNRVQVTAKLTGLQGKTTYYYRVVTTTAGGTVASEVQSFTTN